MNVIRPNELKARIERGVRYQLIDVRSPSEYAAGHIPGAMNVPMEQAEARFGDLHPQDPVVLVCQSGRRAGIACETLSSLRENVIVLEGGTAAWQAHGLPVIGDGPSGLPLMRQVHLVVGTGVLAATLLGALADPRWLFLSGFFGLGLGFAGATGWCGLAMMLAKAPWNRPRRAPTPALKTIQTQENP
jgi:rhodanese-related sulfurtransferase